MAESNPWTTRSNREVYANPWITVKENEVLNPAGNPGIYGVVHFVHQAVGVVPLAADGTTWLVGQYRYTTNAYSWEIPEGGARPGEASLVCAKRELREETGLTAETWTPIFSNLQTSNCVCDEVGHLFLAQGLTLGDAEPEETEELRLMRLPLSEAIAMALRGEIQDALSLIALFQMRCLGHG